VSTDRRREQRRTKEVLVPAERRSAERRRGDRRSEARAPLDLWVEEERGNELYFRRTGNVSLGGIYFEQTIPHALGTLVRLRFSLPGSSDLIEAKAEIVNTPSSADGLGMGLRFVELPEPGAAALRRFLDDEATSSPGGGP
jgi:uncharacterized protein (TIGR02266 family)